jgi:GT2 family glycosyltransferase
MNALRPALRVARRLDYRIGRLCGRIRVLVDVRTPLNLTVLRPVWQRLLADPRIEVQFAEERGTGVREALEAEGLAGALIERDAALWRRFDLAMTADLWNHTKLRRCRRTINFFHGVAGKYSLDDPLRLRAASLSRFDRVAFINEDRLERYVGAGIVDRSRAVLVGLPRNDDLVNGVWRPEVVRASLGLSPSLPTIVYAPTFSPASSLHAGGETLVSALLDTGCNVIVKLHDRSMVPHPRFTDGVDWSSRLSIFDANPRFVLAKTADAGPLLAAADVMVTDHSTVGFEFALLDRPVIVFDAPALREAARIDGGKWDLLRSMADVVRTVPELPVAVARALSNPGEHSAERRSVARSLFAFPGSASDRALEVVYGLLELDWVPRRRAAARPDATSVTAAMSAPVPAPTGGLVKYSIVIATYNRATDLRGTLASLAALTPADPWEVIVVDNNSKDDTPAVVLECASRFPVPLRYAFEATPGRSAALNTGIGLASGDIIVTTDDDVRVDPDWLDRAGEALARHDCGYVGGKVLPIWGGPRPSWLPDRGGYHWGVIALLDYGSQPIEFGRKVPLGVNMAFRREALQKAGGMDPRIGRKAGTLLGQEVREWCLRARAKGITGYYAPEMSVQHIIPAARLQKSYFRRWFYWRGISRALLFQQQGLDMEAPERDASAVAAGKLLAGVPRYLYRSALSKVGRAIAERLRGRHLEAFEHELWLCMFAGIVRQRWRDRHQRPATVAASQARTAA